MIIDSHSYKVNGITYHVKEGELLKVCDASDGSYHYGFSKNHGGFIRWGQTPSDDPQFCPAGPEILDLEISVNGCPNDCAFCYKGNTNEPATNMSFETFKIIFDKIPKVLTQVAFGITGVQTNPDFLKMMHYCRDNGVIPNFTLTGIDLTDKLAQEIADVVGALAVSAHPQDKDMCYDTVKKFTDLGVKQTNIHVVVSEETLDFAREVVKDRLSDPRLKDMNAIVFLGLKPKGRAKDKYHPLSSAAYAELVAYCLSTSITFGFDSCSAPKFEEAVSNADMPEAQKKRLKEYSESCESSLFSSYINTEGIYFPCSFTEGEEGQEGIDVVAANDFIEDVWHHETAKRFRKRLLAGAKDGCRECVAFPEINE